MLVRKLKEEWKPAENKELKVGEIIDITDPRLLIKMGIVEEATSQPEVKVLEENPHVCNRCGRGFKTVGNLKTHERFCKL